MRNLITDVAGVRVGNAHDAAVASGVTVAVFDEQATVSVSVQGGALVAVNAVGSAVIGDGPQFWAGALEREKEIGGLGWPASVPEAALAPRFKGGAPPSTTIGLVATDATLTKAECKRLAIMAHDGLARALRPTHAPMDGDTVFAAATRRNGAVVDAVGLTELGMAAADCVARAIARGVYEASALPFPGALRAWRDQFGRR